MSERRDPVPPIRSSIRGLVTHASQARDASKEAQVDWEEVAEDLMNVSANVEDVLERMLEVGLLDAAELVTKEYVEAFLAQRRES